jgi:hypothetical protein
VLRTVQALLLLGLVDPQSHDPIDEPQDRVVATNENTGVTPTAAA